MNDQVEHDRLIKPNSPMSTDIEQEQTRARELLDTLDNREQDILGLITLGLNNEEISKIILHAANTIRNNYAPAIYRKLGIEKQGPTGRKLRPKQALQIAWDGNLLMQALKTDDASTSPLPFTREVLDKNRLGEGHVTLMNNHGLTVQQMRVAELLAQGLTHKKISQVLSTPRSTITQQVKRIKEKFGTEEEDIESFSNTLTNLGETAIKSDLQ